MAPPTKADLEARRDQIDLQLARLIRLPSTYMVGRTQVDTSGLIATLREELDCLQRQIRSIDEPALNSLNGPIIESV